MTSKHILLHVCCGPCACFPVKVLREQGFQVTAIFINPNIHPLREYLLRREAMEQCAVALDLPMLWEDSAWDIHAWLEKAQGEHAYAPKRCTLCYSSRLMATAMITAEHGFSAFSSSLFYSRYQNHQSIIDCANKAAHAAGSALHYEDFRRGWEEGIALSKALHLYRQAYCGCIYSEAERYAKKLARLTSM